MNAKAKKIPDGLSNFETLRSENYVYVDKTRFIEQIENEVNSYCFLIRPRKFGKTLFLSVLEHYYDLRFEDRFQELLTIDNSTPFEALKIPNDSIKTMFENILKKSYMIDEI